MSDAAFGFVVHPLSVEAHILGEPLRAAIALVDVVPGMHRRPSGEFRRNLD
jgi:hypothetical protein